MKDLDLLLNDLYSLEGKGYGAYKSIKGAYAAPRLDLHIEYVQGDPFAAPSRLRAVVTPGEAELPEWATRTRDRRRAAADFINRGLAGAFQAAPGSAGSGKSGELGVLRPRQQVLERTAVAVDPAGGVEARFRVGLPARGRRILGRVAAELVGTTLLDALYAGLMYSALDPDALRAHVETVEDAVHLRGQLRRHGLVAFVADGARLPRRSGVDDRPLEGDGVVPFRSPATLCVTLEAPNAGPVEGMGVPQRDDLDRRGRLPREVHAHARVGARCVRPRPRRRSGAGGDGP